MQIISDRIIEAEHFVLRCVIGPAWSEAHGIRSGGTRFAVAGGCRAAAARPGRGGLTVPVWKDHCMRALQFTAYGGPEVLT